MKNNVTYFTLILFAALQATSGYHSAWALTSDQDLKRADVSQTKVTDQKDAPKAIQAAAPGAASQAAQVPPASQTGAAVTLTQNNNQAATANTQQPPPSDKRTDVPVSPDEMFKNGLSAEFHQDILQVTGSIPTACSGYLSVHGSDTQPAKNSSDDDIKRDNMTDHASTVGLTMAFSASNDMKSLSACVDAHKTDLDKTDLSTIASLQKIVPNASKEFVLGGFIDNSNKVVLGKKPAMSDAYKSLYDELDPKKLEAAEKKHCASCNVKDLEQMADLHMKGLDTLIESTLEAEIAAEDEVIKAAKDIKDLEKARKDLITYADFISKMNSDKDKKDEIASQVAQRFESVLTKANTLALDHPKEASAYASFIASTYGAEADLPGISDDSRKEALQFKSDFEIGGTKRVNFLVSIDPTNKEVKAALDSGRSSLNRLSREVNSACMLVFSESALARCNTAKQNYFKTYSELGMIQTRYQQAQQLSLMTQMSLRNQMYGMQMSGFNGFNTGLNANFNGTAGMYGLPTGVFPSAANVNGGLYMANPNQANYLYGLNSYPNNYAFNGAANINGLYGVNSNPLMMNASLGAGANLYPGSPMMNPNIARTPSAINMTPAIPINLNYTANPQTQLLQQQQQAGPFVPSFSFSDSTTDSVDVSGS